MGDKNDALSIKEILLAENKFYYPDYSTQIPVIIEILTLEKY